ncbi:MAG: DUF86 domain-containing protein [Pseudomonadota bacterium]
MPRDYRLYMDDILESCQKIRQFTHGVSFQEFKEDVMVQDAVMRNFEIIGEAVNHLPDQIKSLYHDVELADIVGFRNILAHGYFEIKLETVWSAIEEGLPDLEQQTKALLGEES